MNVCTYWGALDFTINGINGCHDKHKAEEKCEEQERVEEHPIRNPPRPDFNLDELPHSFPREHRYVPQARRDMKLHCCYSFCPRIYSRERQWKCCVVFLLILRGSCYFIWQITPLFTRERPIVGWELQSAKSPWRDLAVKGRFFFLCCLK